MWQSPKVARPTFRSFLSTSHANMASSIIFLVILSICLGPIFVQADTCLAPEVTLQSYSTSEAIVSTETVLIGEFTLKCKNGLKNINLYAEIGDKTLPVSKTADPNRYQISMTDEHKNLPSGNYEFRIFDEEGFAALRKAQRSGESTESLKPLFTITLSHGGIWSGPLVQSEFVAAMSAILVWWLAYTARSKLLA